MRVGIEGAYTYGQLTLDGYTKIGHRNVPLYCNTVIGTYWTLMGRLLHMVQQRGEWAGCAPAHSPL